MKNFNKGFTLIELLVVITIIGILTIITVGSFVTSQQKSRDASRKSELKNLADALNMYYVDNNSFPLSNEMNALISNQSEFSKNSVVYMKKVPKGNASGTTPIYYQVSSTGKSFRLYTNLENADDGSCFGGVDECHSIGYVISSGCCYILTSSNIGVTGVLL